MLEKFVFGRRTVKWRNNKHAIGAQVLCFAAIAYNIPGILRSCPNQHRYPLVRLVDNNLGNPVTFFVVQRQEFSGACDRNQSMHAVCNLPFHEAA